MAPNKKTSEERAVEGFFVAEKKNVITTEKKVKEIKINPKDILKNTTEKKVASPQQETTTLKQTVSKKYRQLPKNKIEVVEKVKGKKKTTRKVGKSKKIIKKFSPKTTVLKKGGYELIITEKPQAATKIATSLGDATQKIENKVSYYTVNRNGKKIVVACAVGHLFTLKQDSPGSKVPTFEVSWIPNYLALKKDFTKRYFETIDKLSKNAGEITVATDYDHEGELIGLNVVRYICGQPDANRMKFSTLTKEELNSSYENKTPTIDWGQAIAGETRHYLDWYYGINLSRALMNSIKTTGKFKIMSIGRVQGPTLNLIVEKEKEINSFKKEKYWQIFVTVKDEKNEIELKYNKDIFDKPQLEIFSNIVGEMLECNTKKSVSKIPPKSPFNLTELQKEAYSHYGITPSRTLQIAQSLYLSGMISYPRTSSQKLPKSIGYEGILKKVALHFKATHLISRNTPIEGPKSDPAHPSIYPTGNFIKLSGQDEKIYNLIAKRFIALFCPDAIVDKKRVTGTWNKHTFSANGSQLTVPGWTQIYPTKTKYQKIPDMDGPAKATNKRIEEKETQPPKRYSPASILSELEKRNLGTKATRASIIETLYDRGYIRGTTSIEATKLGISLIDTLGKYSQIIIDEKLTQTLQEETDAIVEAKDSFEEKEKVILDRAKKTIIKISKDFEQNEKKIGEELIGAELIAREEQKKENELVECPLCKKGKLAITYSPRFKNFFVACNAYPNCRNTYSLPQNGTIKKTEKVCEECGFPMLMRLSHGRRPWVFCFNKNCPTNIQKIKHEPEE